jgi:hypothetical protein
MTTFFSIVIFIIILTIYLHVMEEYKISEDLEIYEMDFKDNKQLQDICNLKQPVLFNLEEVEPTFFKKVDLIGDSQTSVIVKDKSDIDNSNYIKLPYDSAKTLINTDTSARFYSERNSKITSEICFDFKKLDTHLKPALTIQSKREMLFGSKGAHTVMRYHTEHRKFLAIRNGRINVKMTPWRSNRLLHITKDYVNYDFRSKVDVWEPQPKYESEMEQLKFLEFDVDAGYVLNIPPYWFYSIKYPNEDRCEIYELTYNTPMNFISNFHLWGVYYIQQQNLKRIFLKPFQEARVTQSKNCTLSNDKLQEKRYNNTPRDKIFKERKKDSAKKKKEKNKNIELPLP